METRHPDLGVRSPARSRAGLAATLCAMIAIAGCSTTVATTPPSVPVPSTSVPSASPSSAPPSATPSLPPTTDAAGNPILIGAGDIARCDAQGDEATAALIAGLPGIVFTLGDNAYEDGTAKQLQDCYAPSWGQFLARTQFAVMGNHDIRTDAGAPNEAYFGNAMTRNGVTWFSQDVGTWHVVVLDADCTLVAGLCGVGSPQQQWLTADLAANHQPCTIALWHQPLFSSGVHRGDLTTKPFWDALYAAGAELVLNGHEHDYERFAPQDPAGKADAARGITEVIAGTGGAVLRDFAQTAPNSVVRQAFTYGVLSITLQPDGYDARFISTDGSFSDAFSGTCH
jgi:hypothetical protein